MTSQIKIRRALLDDAESLSHLIFENAQATLSDYYNAIQMSVFKEYYSPEVMRQKIADQDVFCAEIDGEIVGTVALEGNFVMGFYTKTGYLNQGIGKLMMQYLENFARKKGVEEIQLAASPVGVAFYNKNGWTKIKPIVFEYLGVGFDETLMVKKLK